MMLFPDVKHLNNVRSTNMNRDLMKSKSMKIPAGVVGNRITSVIFTFL